MSTVYPIVIKKIMQNLASGIKIVCLPLISANKIKHDDLDYT